MIYRHKIISHISNFFSNKLNYNKIHDKFLKNNNVNGISKINNNNNLNMQEVISKDNAVGSAADCPILSYPVLR
jgi:hypothetical protein